MQPERGIEGTRPPAGDKKEPSGLFFSAPGCGSQHPSVPWAARLFAHCFLCRAYSSGGRLIIPKQQAPPQKAGDSRLFGVNIS